MDLSLNFATDDAAPRGRKAKPAAGARRRQQQQQKGKSSFKSQPAVTGGNADGHASSASTSGAPARSAANSHNAGGHHREQPQQQQQQHAGASTSEQDAAAKTPLTGRPQVISSLFPKFPPGTRRPEVAATVAPDEAEDSPATVLDPSNAPSMADDFASLPLRANMVAHLKGKMGLAHPTTIQKLAVPFLCNSETRQKDAILQAQTGSGKTLSYLLPIIEDLLRISSSVVQPGKPIDRSIGTMAIILVPTRELANQIFEVACRLLSFASDNGSASHRWITPGLLTGGAHRQHEKARLRKGIPLLIATPGRLLDHLETTKAFRIAGEVVRKPKDPSSSRGGQDAIDSDDEFAIEDSLQAPLIAPEGGEDEVSSDEDFEGKGVSRSHRRNAPLTSSQESTINPHLNLRWLVLDEADRLMDMGFEPQITSIMNLLSSRLDKRKAALARALNNGDVRSRLAGQRRKYIELDQRRTLLCSATIQENVEKLAGVALKEPLLIKGDGDTAQASKTASKQNDGSSWSHYAPPSQLSQMYATVEPKLRFVALIALLRQLLLSPATASAPSQKILVFLSCTDSVDLHWHAMANLRMGREPGGELKKSKEDAIRTQSVILPGTAVYRLHGSLDLKTRLSSLKAFASNKSGPAVLFCTSVAARGLDVPDVNCVIQYDLPTEGGVTEYVHRVGRTARAGAGGQSWVFLLPSEAGWVDWAEKEMKQSDDGSVEKRLHERTIHSLLKSGYGGKDARDYETRATDVQMAYERWVADDSSNLNLARKAFSSHVRAYATHPSNEKEIFHVKNLHLGHLAKAFGLREAPAGIGGVPKQKKQAAGARLAPENKRKRPSGNDSDSSEEPTPDPKRPTIPRSGRALEGKGLHGPHGVTRRDFNIANTSALEALVARKGVRK